MPDTPLAKVVMALIALSLLTAAGCAWLRWQSIRPSPANFDRAARALWEKNPGGESSAAGFAGVRQCLPLPDWPRPDAQSKAGKPLAWSMDFITEGVRNNARLQQLQQLDQLAEAGLLEKEAVVMETGGVAHNGMRYRLSLQGWIASDPRGSEGSKACFVYGRSQYLGLSSARALDEKHGQEVYEVKARTGLRSADDLEPWARSPALQEAFPEIRKQLAGEDFKVLLASQDGEWVDYQEAMANPRPATPASNAQGRKTESGQPPRQEEIEAILKQKFSAGKAGRWPPACLYLPGAEKLPVDADLSDYRARHYEVAIFTNDPRSPWDDVIVKKTQPYLSLLEQLGIMQKETRQGVSGRHAAEGKLHDAMVYSLTPDYAGRTDKSQLNCLPLGAPTVDIARIDIREKDPDSAGATSFHYKLRLHYPYAPTWLQDPRLLAGWPELRNALQQGYACEGQYDFNPETRGPGQGAGSCWWAFDSYYENW